MISRIEMVCSPAVQEEKPGWLLPRKDIYVCGLKEKQQQQILFSRAPLLVISFVIYTAEKLETALQVLGSPC